MALIAGFAEIGETIEETVHREVMEEVGIRVKNLRFYKSQPWCFTDTLLFGFSVTSTGQIRCGWIMKNWRQPAGSAGMKYRMMWKKSA